MIRFRGKGKYRNIWTKVDGINFQSKMEATRYQELRQLEAGRAIQNLERQVRYKIQINGIIVATYVADFRYVENGNVVVEDSKGFITPDFKIKYALMKAALGIEVKLIGRNGKRKDLAYKFA